jgi:hypothetical protein
MIFQKIAQSVNYLVDQYNRNPRFSSLTNVTFGASASLIAGAVLDGTNHNLATLVEGSGAIGTAVYANEKINDDSIVANNGAKTIAKLSLAALVGWEIADLMSSYHGASNVGTQLRNSYLTVHAKIANNVTGIHQEPATGAIVSTLTAAALRVRHYSQELRTIGH